MKVTVCFDTVRVVVPCGDGSFPVRDLMHEAILRYKKATGKSDCNLTINSLSLLNTGGILDPDDRLCDVADDREQIVASFLSSDVIHISGNGDGASSVGTNSPDGFYAIDINNSRRKIGSSMKRESTKRLSMHVMSTREPACLTPYSALSLPRESRRREPLGQDSKVYEVANANHSNTTDNRDVVEVVIKSEPGPLGLHVVPCYDLLGNDQGLRVEGIEPAGRIARDGQIDLHDKIVKINGHNLLRMPFTKVQEIFRVCMNEKCLKISVIKSSRKSPEKSFLNNSSESKINNQTSENDESMKRSQCSTYNLLQTANTRKIGKMIEIELTKGNYGLGFSVTTRDNPAGGHCPIYIKNILPKGAAVEDGRLKPGDRLLEVNNLEMTGKSQAEVVALLRSIVPGGKVRLIVSRQEEVPSNISDSNCVGVPVVVPEVVRDSKKIKNWKSYESPPKEPKLDDSKTGSSPSSKKNRIVLTLDIPVHDSEKAGLGVSVKGKTSTSDDGTNIDLGIFIKSVLNGGAASRDGRLRTNDQLLNVNGVSLLGLSNSDAMETLRRAMLNKNSAITGVISLTIARRASAYDEKSFNKSETNSVYIVNNTGQDQDNNNHQINKNVEPDIVDHGNLRSPTTSWNPVIDRLAEQYNKNSLRNESYCLATGSNTWMDPAVKKLNFGDPPALMEESNEKSHNSEVKIDDKESLYSNPTYDSQLSLEELGNCSSNKFSRDAIGRQSMSEKRHAALDAKSTDTYKKNKKLREGRESKTSIQTHQSSQQGGKSIIKIGDFDFGQNSSKGSSMRVGENSSIDSSRSNHSKQHYSKNLVQNMRLDCLYTIPGCNNKLTSTSPRKHWLVDEHVTSGHCNQDSQAHYRHELPVSGFAHSRGDFKQASLNSALDGKRTRKKSGLRSMLRLGKNRKSLNFGDNLDGRLEANNYCSGTINYIA